MMNIDNASQIKFALDIPQIGQFVGIVMTIFGIILMSMTHLKRIICRLSLNDSKALLSKTDEVERVKVIKDYEMNSLIMCKTQSVLHVNT